MKNVLTSKLFDVKRLSLLMIGAVAMLVASTATSICPGMGFYEPEMPKSLYKDKE